MRTARNPSQGTNPLPPPTVFRLMDGAGGRPGNGPAATTAYGGPYLAGIVFEVATGGMWLSGFWWWVPLTGGSTGTQPFALWQGTGATSGILISGATANSGTLTAGQWNYVPLATPAGLSIGTPYVAATGYTSVNGFPDTPNQFGAGQPYAAGISNYPLSAYSDQGASDASPAGESQGLFGTASADPTSQIPYEGASSSNFWIDVQVTTTAPVGTSYRLWPNLPLPTNLQQDTATNFTLATEFQLTRQCTLNKIWFYSPTGTTQLPTECGIWVVNTQSLFAGTDNSSPTWSGAAGSGWVSVSYGSVTLPAGDYKVAVLNAAGSPVIWNDATLNYFATLQGANGITNGPLSAPSLAAATPPGQGTYNTGSTFVYPLTYSGAANGACYWVDVEVTPS